MTGRGSSPIVSRITYVFPSEKVGNSFKAGMMTGYETDPTKPILSWKNGVDDGENGPRASAVDSTAQRIRR